MDSVLVPAEVAVTESFYNQYLESGNNVEVKVDENAEHGFVRDTLQFSSFLPYIDGVLQPSSDQGGPCDQLNSPNYVSNCNYDGAFSVLSKVVSSCHSIYNFNFPSLIQIFQTLGSIQQKEEGDTSDGYTLKYNC